MCKLWRETFSKQQSLQCSPGKNAAENEQCNITHTCHQKISATTSYIDRIPSCTYKGHRHQEESHVKYFSQRSQQLLSCCCKTSSSEVCGVSSTWDIQVCSLNYQVYSIFNAWEQSQFNRKAVYQIRSQ